VDHLHIKFGLSNDRKNQTYNHNQSLLDPKHFLRFFVVVVVVVVVESASDCVSDVRRCDQNTTSAQAIQVCMSLLYTVTFFFVLYLCFDLSPFPPAK
jgi:hypothetical protein